MGLDVPRTHQTPGCEPGGELKTSATTFTPSRNNPSLWQKENYWIFKAISIAKIDAQHRIKSSLHWPLNSLFSLPPLRGSRGLHLPEAGHLWAMTVKWDPLISTTKNSSGDKRSKVQQTRQLKKKKKSKFASTFFRVEFYRNNKKKGKF